MSSRANAPGRAMLEQLSIQEQQPKTHPFLIVPLFLSEMPIPRRLALATSTADFLNCNSEAT